MTLDGDRGVEPAEPIEPIEPIEPFETPAPGEIARCFFDGRQRLEAIREPQSPTPQS
jgi:hypothetical protein